MLLYEGINNSGQMMYHEDRPNFPFNYRAVEEAWRSYLEDWEELWKLMLQRSAIPERLLPERFGERSIVHQTVTPERLITDGPLRNTYAGAHSDNWEKIWTVATAFGIRPRFALQPTSLCPLAPEGTLDSETTPFLYANYLVYEDMREAARHLVNRNPDVTWLDLSGLLPAEAFHDGAHVFDEQIRVIADRLAAFLVDDLQELAQASFESP